MIRRVVWLVAGGALVGAAAAFAAGVSFGIGATPDGLGARVLVRAAKAESSTVRLRDGVIAAAFAKRSAAVGSTVVLRVRGIRRSVVLQMFRVGAERLRPVRDDVLAGIPVTSSRRVAVRSDGTVEVDVANWPSGFYYAELADGDEYGYAPLVVKPPSLGSSRALVVLPTHTWQAYNRRDDDGDGVGDTWYEDRSITVVDLSRPYLDHGVPPHFRGYDRAFLRWLSRTGKRADFVADDDLERIASGAQLARLYDLVVFSGHAEYVGRHVLDVITEYRNRGGNLIFLGANTFYYAVKRRGDELHGRTNWGRLGRPAAMLTGSDYVGWSHGRYPNKPYVVKCARSASWLLRGTGLRNGDSFGHYGIEVDARSRHSPRSTVVLARIDNAIGPGADAEMTYYETANGAKVFSAGALNFGGSLEYEPQSTIMENLWQRLVAP